MQDNDLKDIIKALLVLPTVKRELEQIQTAWEESDGSCPYCSSASDEPHTEDCIMLTIHAILDGIYSPDSR